MAQEADKTFWIGHVTGFVATLFAHAALVVLLVLFHGAGGGAAAAAGMPAVPPPPSIQAKLVKLGRPANVRRTRTESVVATSPQTGIALSKTGREETKQRPTKAPLSKNAAVDDALQRTLAHAANLGQQGSPEAGIGSPDGVEGGEIDAAEAREIDLYYSMLQRLFRANFRVPATSGEAPVCLVRVPINRDLSVGAPVIVRSSGDATFDQAAVAAARAVNTVPPPPPEIADQVLGRGFPVRYRGASN